MVVTNDPSIAERARSLKDLGHSPHRRFLHREVAFNYRMTNIQGAIGLAQLENMERYVEARREHAALYNAILGEVPGVVTPPEKEWAKNVYWMYSILLADEFCVSRDSLMSALRTRGVDTRAFFIPMHRQPALFHIGLFEGAGYPVAEGLSERGLYLPSGSGLNEEQIRFICQAVGETRERAHSRHYAGSA
jgi:perosamine synthetase